MPTGEIRTVFESREHDVFLGSDDHIYTARRDGIHLVRPDTSWISAFVEDEKGTVWIGGIYDLYAYRNGKIASAIKMNANEGVFAITEDHQRRVWVGTPHGLLRMAKDGASLKPLANKALRSGVNRIIEDGEGSLWIGTASSGLVRMNGDSVSSFKATDGLTDNKILALFEDREGSLWVGTASGLDRFRNTKLITMTVKEGLPSDDATSAISARDGSIYVLCSYGGLARIQNGKVVSTVTRIPGLPSIHGGALYEAKDGSLWLGAFGALTRIKDGKISVYDSDPRISKRYISVISEDDEGLFVGTSDLLLVRIRNGRAVPFTVHGKTTPLSSPGNYTFTIYRQPAGTLWFGTEKGLFKFVPGAIPVRQPGIDFPVTVISDGGQGTLWLGGRTSGIVRFRIPDGRVSHYSRRDGLFDEDASSILLDDIGGFWISTSKGIYRVLRKDLDDFADGRISNVPSTTFGTTDGMKTSEATSIPLGSAGCKGADGKLWFTTVAGIVSIDPRNIPLNSLSPPVELESVTADNLRFPPGGEIRIPSNKDKMEFHYTALSLRAPERVRFRYRLEGYDRDWVEAGTRRVAYYNNLPPGKYRFRVIASNDDGLWNLEGAGVSFSVQPHYYQTLWFYGLCGMILAALLFGILRFNTRRLRAMEDELKRQVDQRTKALQLEVQDRQRAEGVAIEARDNMRFQATHDSLTLLLNRGAILELLKCELSRSRRERSFTVVLMADLDHFKKVNDLYGHQVGDEVLREVARRLVISVRPYDLVGRYGGEEFLIVLSNCEVDTAMERAEELRQAIAAVPVVTACGPISLTTSVGVFAIQNWTPLSADEVVRHVDAALYFAKDSGRNCCHLADVGLSSIKTNNCV